MHPWMIVRALCVPMLAALAVLLAPSAARCDARSEVIAALHDTSRWLGEGPNAEKWRTYLAIETLEAELAKGAGADPAMLATVYDRFATVPTGPATAPLDRLQVALANWLVEQSNIPAADLPALARQAKDQLAPRSTASAGKVKRRLRGALGRLAARLRAAGPNGEHWRKYLQQDELAAQIEAAQPDPEKLRQIHERFVGKYPGLEMTPFVDVRSALSDYVTEATLASAGDDANATFQALLDDLAARLETVAQGAQPNEVDNIGAAVTELERYGQAPRVVWAVRRHFAQPNLHLHASRQFLVTALSRDVDDTAPVQDMILGTDIHGTGRTVGRSEITPIPSSREAALLLVLSGKTYSDTVGYNGPVQVYSSGETDIFGQKKLYLRPQGLLTGPATARAATRTNIRGITTNRHGFLGKIILKAANKRAAQSKRQAERIASEHAADRIRARLDGEAAERLSVANRGYREKFLAPLVRYNVYPERLQFSTSQQGLDVTGVIRAADRLAAHQDAPGVADGADLTLRIHESALNNLARSILLGQTVTQERAIEIYRNLQDPKDRNQPLPKEVAIDPVAGPWSVTLASDVDATPRQGDNMTRDFGPVTVRIDDGKIRATVHGVRYEVNGTVHETAMDIIAVYRLDQSPDGWRFVRDGDPQVFPPGRDPNQQGTLSVRETTLRNEMQQRFKEKKTFPDTIEIDHRQPKGELAKVGELRVMQASADDGWLMIAWQAAAPKVQVATVRP